MHSVKDKGAKDTFNLNKMCQDFFLFYWEGKKGRVGSGEYIMCLLPCY